MKTFEQNEPLTDAEIDRLVDFLETCKGGMAMNVEELDGFFAALIAGPEIVMPSEYLTEVFGGEISDTCEFSSLEEVNELLGLLTRHWNDIAGTLLKGEAYVPMLFEDDDGTAHGNNWARGFMRGVDMRNDSWAGLLENDTYVGCILPMMMLFHEHDDDPEMRPETITPEKREKVILHMAAGLVGAYRYFRQRQQDRVGTTFESEPRRTASKVVGNEPCPCGSGKKYKKCCGGVTVN